jgi:hypothetical protein
MPAEAVEAWFRSRKVVSLDGLRLRPLPDCHLPNTPLCVQRGQAEVVFCQSEDGRAWLLKKFHAGRAPNLDYLSALTHKFGDVFMRPLRPQPCADAAGGGRV